MMAAQLKQSKSKFQLSEYIEQELFSLRKNIQEQINQTNIPNTSVCSYLQTSIHVKNGFMELVQRIQAQQLLAQIQRERIESNKILLQGFNAVKEKWRNQVKQSEIEMMEFEKQLEKSQKFETLTNVQKNQTNLQNQLEQIDKKNQRYQKRLLQKKRLQTMIIQKNQLYSKIIPESTNRIRNQLQKTLESFIQNLSRITNKDLAIINKIFNDFKDENKNRIEISYSKGELDQELQIVICPSKHVYFQACRANGIKLQEKEIKLIIASVTPYYEKLVIGIDGIRDLTNEDIFQKLYNNEEIQTIFENPTTNEIQCAINSKYIKLNWINEVLLNGEMSPKNFLNLIKQRVFCVQLMQYLCKNVKTVDFFFPLSLKGEYFIQRNMKSITQGTLQKITFQQYLQLVHTPNWLDKYLAIYEDVQFKVKSQRSSQHLTNRNSNQLLQSVLKILKLEELVQKNLNFYYKGTFTIVYKELTFILIVPKIYPSAPSKINIIKWQNKIKNEDNPINLGQPPLWRYSGRQTPLNDRILAIQQTVNEQITQFIKNEQINVFRTLFQLNRLLTLLSDPQYFNEQY